LCIELFNLLRKLRVLVFLSSEYSFNYGFLKFFEFLGGREFGEVLIFESVGGLIS